MYRTLAAFKKMSVYINDETWARGINLNLCVYEEFALYPELNLCQIRLFYKSIEVFCRF